MNFRFPNRHFDRAATRMIPLPQKNDATTTLLFAFLPRLFSLSKSGYVVVVVSRLGVSSGISFIYGALLFFAALPCSFLQSCFVIRDRAALLFLTDLLCRCSSPISAIE